VGEILDNGLKGWKHQMDDLKLALTSAQVLVRNLFYLKIDTKFQSFYFKQLLSLF